MEIKDLKIGDILIGDSCKSEYKVIDFSKKKKVVFVKPPLGILVLGMDNQTLNRYSLKMEIPKKIQGFEVGEYDGELVEVRDNEDSTWYIVELKRVTDVDYPFIDIEGELWKYCRPVSQEKRKFIDLKE